MGNPVGWFEIYVDDMDRARKFYEAVFQVELAKLDGPDIEMYMWPMGDAAPGSSGALVKSDDCPAGNNSVIVYFMCDDCSVEESRVDGAGGRVDRPKMSIGQYGFISLVYDTEGNMIGLHSMK